MECEYPQVDVDWMSRKPYTVSGKSIETRMRVVIDQLLIDMITDTDMDQLKKMTALKYIDKMRAKMLKLADKEGMSFEDRNAFKQKLAILRLRLTTKIAKEEWELRYDQMFR